MDYSFLSSLPLASISSLVSAWHNSDLLGKLIVLIHFASSIVALAIFIEQGKKFKYYTEISDKFLKHLRELSNLLFCHLNQKDTTGNPAFAIYTDASDRLVSELKQYNPVIETVEDAHHITLSDTSLNFIKVSTEEALTKHTAIVEGRTHWLASIATISPLLGLLGTVMGVLDAFCSMANKGTVNLGDVAPGLSSAMLTTVTGLVVAIITAALYNHLLPQFRNLCSILDAFTDEYIARCNAEFGPKQ